LKTHIEESARKVILGFVQTAINYKEAMNLLEKRFVKPEITKNVQFNTIIKALTVFSEKSVKRIRELFDLIENHYHGLQALKVDEPSYSKLLVPVVMDKIPGPVPRSMIGGSNNQTAWERSEMLPALGTESDIRARWRKEKVLILPQRSWRSSMQSGRRPRKTQENCSEKGTLF